MSIGCSLKPILLDFNGIIRFFTILTRSEEKLQTLLDSSTVNGENKTQTIPEFGQWVITMWHFGRDGMSEHAGEKFSVTVENAEHILTRIYSKDFGKHTRIRIERQEYPKKTLLEAINEKLG